MSKKFFRFMRGELNGYYLTALNTSCNKASESLEKMFSYFQRTVFKNDTETQGNEVPIATSDLKGLSVFSGTFSPYVWQDSLNGSVRFTTSHIVDEHEYSERGLYSVENEAFSFVRTTQQEYATDINTMATKEARSTLVEKDRQPVGYFPEGENIINDDGSLDFSKLLSSPRAGHADSPFYGEEFLYLAEETPVVALLSSEMLLYLIRAMQWVRYNGASIASMVEFSKILCPNFLFITNIDWDSRYASATVDYGIDENYEIQDKLMREQTFVLLAQKKLPQFTFNKVNIIVERDENGKVISTTIQ